MSVLKILIADDHPIFLFGLKSIIESADNMQVDYVVSDGEHALEMISVNKPDVAILDIDMPGLNGIEVTRKVKELALDSKVIILTMHKDEAIFNLALDCGASGYVLKDNAATDIVNSIQTVVMGDCFISPHIIGFYKNRKEGRYNNIISSINGLTSSEKKVLKLIAENKSSNEIAVQLFVSSKTVQNHRFNICKKMELEGVNSLLSFSLQNKYIIDLFLTS